MCAYYMPMKALRTNYNVSRKFGSQGTILDKLWKLADSCILNTGPIYKSKYVYSIKSCILLIRIQGCPSLRNFDRFCVRLSVLRILAKRATVQPNELTSGIFPDIIQVTYVVTPL